MTRSDIVQSVAGALLAFAAFAAYIHYLPVLCGL